MGYKQQNNNRGAVFFQLLVIVVFCACNSTQHIPDGQYLLHKNKVVLHSDRRIANKGEMKDILSKAIIQKPNTDGAEILPFSTPTKLWRYNRRYEKLHSRPDSLLPKSIERPVLLDTSLMQRSALNMKVYLFNQGYFYAKIKDTFYYKHKKAYTTYTVHTGPNYLINSVNYNIADSGIAKIVAAHNRETVLRKGLDFNYTELEDERSRITSLIRNNGYWRFTQDNVNFIKGLDTVDKTVFKDAESPFEAAAHFMASTQRRKRPTIDITGYIQQSDDSLSFRKYTIASVTVYPDYQSNMDLTDTSMITKEIGGITYKYHKDYVHAKVLDKHIFVVPGERYSQGDQDKTYTKLSELGIFQYVRPEFSLASRNSSLLNCNILLNRAKKHDVSTNYEISSGSTYSLGNSLGVNYRDRNFAKGANLLTIGVNGGVELAYNTGSNFIQNFSLLTKYYGLNASIDFPKFLSPFAASLFPENNLPHTIIGGGENVIDRVNYFTLINTSANFTYSWHRSQTITWTLSPAFVNIISLPVETDSFKKVLSTNDYLKNSYKQNFIEGENLTFTYDDIAKTHAHNYSFLKLGVEEAGALLGGINQLGVALNNLYSIQYAQYYKFDFDARHYFTLPHSVFAFRFYGGVGVPYGQSDALPYIKQYFAGGPYSLRGWRIRTLGPGSYYDITAGSNTDQIDRTGDIKLELNGEFRFPISMLFAGAVKMNGVIFGDAGNIWLAKKDPSYVGGNFDLEYLGQDIAADMGGGLRFDIASFLTFRLEAAIPVKKPYVDNNYGWVFNQIDIFNSTWRVNNLIVFASIGYPF